MTRAGKVVVALLTIASLVAIGFGFAIAWHIGNLPVHTPQDLATESAPLFSAAALTASVVLAWITGYYALQNRQMVQEMTAARTLTVRPHLVIDLHAFGPTHVDVRLTNVGPGTATDVGVDLEFLRLDGRATERRTFVTSVLTVNSHHDFGVPRDIRDAPDLASKVKAIRLQGRARDVYGGEIIVDDQIGDLHEWWSRTSTADIVFAQPIEKLQLDVLKDIATSLSSLSRSAESIRPERERRPVSIRHSTRRPIPYVRRLRGLMQSLLSR